MRRALFTFALLLLPLGARAQQWRDIPDEEVERQLDHFPESNERRRDLFYPLIADRGGALLGVGSDQTYSLGAVADASAIFIVDYDPVVTRIHRSLIALIRRCPDAACVRAHVGPSQEEESLRWIAEDAGQGFEAERTRRTFLLHRPMLRDHLGHDGEAWIDRPELYARIHRLARAGRIVARTADLRGTRTIRAIAAAARREGIAFTTVYLSNAEEYFSYGPSFVENLAALPASESALVLRTLRDRRLPRPSGDHGWHYGVQPLSDLLHRLRDLGYADSSWIVRDLIDAGAPPSPSRLDASVPARAQAGPRRWWLEPRDRQLPERPRRESRLLRVARRALGTPAVDLAETGLAHVGEARLPVDPQTQARFVLEGEARDVEQARTDEPEQSLHALLMDAVAREVVAPLFEEAGLALEAATIRRTPVAADRYAAVRLRDRLLEQCPPERRGAREIERALRACREASRLIRPVRTRRELPSWSEQERELGSALRALGRAGDREGLTAALERLARIARAIEPIER